MGTQTPKRRLLDLLIDGGLEQFVTSRREAGESWRRICFDIEAVYDVEITDVTLRDWFPQLVAPQIANSA